MNNSESNLAVVKVDYFRGTTTPDKNGKQAVILIAIAGTIPNRNVLSGTVAEMQGLEVGKSYLVQVRKRGTDTVFGEDWTWTKVQELTSIKDVLEAQQMLGNGDVFKVQRPEGFEKIYHRKGDKVVSLQTERAKKGQYEFANGRNLSDETAKSVVEGTTIKGATKEQLNLTENDLPEIDHKQKVGPKDESLNP